MKNLSTYVHAILRKTGPLAICDEAVEKTCWQDQGFEVCKEVCTYCFSDGAVIRRTVEQDNFPSEAACAECWITYEVLSSGEAGGEITPPRKVFDNACRESFWLAYHTS